ncbi:hypothetical protein [Williamsia sp. 1135]|uniref:hypothetical protein n=1 Tax=Williamsia sp. 1135 TaxID=1889262 RepID=UPI000A11496F|nr:hypothetical protein [Williamsia sp. 1135]ORM35713.1 hypothetical protein BFL43_09095 [Williamsia sp. 1135]
MHADNLCTIGRQLLARKFNKTPPRWATAVLDTRVRRDPWCTTTTRAQPDPSTGPTEVALAGGWVGRNSN